MFTRFTIAAALATTLGVAAVAPAANGAGLPVLTAEYSADRVMETDAGTFEGKVYAAKGKERTETTMRGMTSAMIMRRDRQLAWMLMPAQKMYRQMDFAQARQQSGAQPADDVDISEAGHETIEGHETTRYKLVLKDGSAGGFMWITKDGIVMKMDTITKNGRNKSRLTMTLKNLHIGPQDPSLFELPAGYTAMPSYGGMGGFGEMGDAMRGGGRSDR